MIPEDKISACLGTLDAQSEPGRTAHGLLLLTAPAGAVNAFGQPDPAALTVDWATIMPVRTAQHPTADDFIADCIAATCVKTHKDGRRVFLAGLVVEAWGLVGPPGDEVRENRARVLAGNGQLDEHPDAVEVSRLYAACRDGRRWSGQRILTGPQAGTITGPDIRVGQPTPDEGGRLPHLIRAAVGITFARNAPRRQENPQ